MSYQTNKWRYKARRKCRCTLIVYARELETAQEIVAVENESNIHYFKPARFFFKKAVLVEVPPYDLEQDQLLTAQKRLERRLKHLEAFPEHRAWLAKKPGGD